MTDSLSPNDRDSQIPSSFPLLERITALVLITVIVSLVWITGKAYRETGQDSPSLPAEVIFVSVLISTALGLVSILSLLKTRS